ncbi:MAG: nitrous oxide reductase accessory protein NosL [Bacteroidia bacterium]
MKYNFLWGWMVLWMACSPEPKQIQYGMDACHYCKMTIMDNQHASQLVTEKGRAYLFDAIECMIGYQQIQKEDFAFVLVSDYANPGTLISAASGTFLISPAVSSPMGANLSAFSQASDALEIKTRLGGEIYTWDEIFARITQTHH